MKNIMTAKEAIDLYGEGVYVELYYGDYISEYRIYRLYAHQNFTFEGISFEKNVKINCFHSYSIKVSVINCESNRRKNLKYDELNYGKFYKRVDNNKDVYVSRPEASCCGGVEHPILYWKSEEKWEFHLGPYGIWKEALFYNKSYLPTELPV